MKLALFSLLASAYGHTFVTTPVSREPAVHTNGGTYECGHNNNIQATYSRGQSMRLEWGRNNHWGGFVQVSVLPLPGNGADVNNQNYRTDFDRTENVFFVACYNSGDRCHACNGCGDKFGLGGDGSGFQTVMCHVDGLQIPTWLNDGNYVMKTTVFGNGDSFGVRNMPHSSYSNCHNFRVQGGSGVTGKPGAGSKNHIKFSMRDQGLAKSNPVSPDGQCMYLGTNTHMGCVPRGGKSPDCSGRVADLSKCGNGGVESRQQCLGNNNDGQTDGGAIYQYVVGVPPSHPNYKESFTLLSHNQGPRTVGSGGSGPAPAPSPSGGGGEVFGIFWIPGQEVNRVLDVAGNSNNPGTKIHTWENLGPGVAQQFWFQANGKNIQWRNTDKCIDVAGGENRDGANVQIWTCDSNNRNQHFRWHANGRNIIWADTDKCLDIDGGNRAAGARVQLWTCNYNSNYQSFQYRKVGNERAAATISQVTLASASKIPKAQISIDWSVPRTEANATVFLVPGSQITFSGTSEAKQLIRVCEDGYNACSTNYCSQNKTGADGKEDVNGFFEKVANGAYMFDSDETTPKTWYYISSDATTTDPTAQQAACFAGHKLQVVVTPLSSSTTKDVLDVINKDVLDKLPEFQSTSPASVLAYSPLVVMVMAFAVLLF